MAALIPATAHFVWIGQDFPWLHWAALASAQRNGGFARLWLHHTHDLSRTRWWPKLRALAQVECRRLQPEAELERALGPKLVDRYRSLSAPAAKANVLRIALLLNHGGVYLDLDTITTQSLTPLREQSSFFCGEERLAFPASLERSRDPLAHAAAFLRTAVRDLARRSARGVKWFHGVRHLYPTAANNAVVGAEAAHPFLYELCGRMLELSRRDCLRRYALGTTLLQHALRDTSLRGLTVLPPEAFYPLGPELSAHWFRLDPRATLDDVLTPCTRVVHWYASVRTRNIAACIDPDWVSRHRERQLLSALLLRALDAGKGFS